MNSRILIALIVLSAGIVAVDVQAAIQIENKTNRLITVWLKGKNDCKFSRPYRIHARRETSLPVQSGIYYVAARMRGGELLFLGWQDYSNHKIVYRIDDSVCCGSQSDGENLPSLESYSLGAEVFRADGRYRCVHGRWHTRWKPVLEEQ